MWPFTAYPEAKACQVNGKTYDYVVVGGGTAGCVLASRLSENPDVSVLVLEKGYVKDNFVSRVPLISQNFWMGDPLQVQSTRYTEPITHANGRKNRMFTAEGIGGASRINAMLWTRGVPGGYEEWATKFGLEDWAWEKVEPWFRKSENALSHADSPERGHDGPIPLQHKSWHFKWPAFVDQAAQKLGLPVGQDCNNPSAPSMGLSNLDMAIHPDGSRASAYNTYLNKKVARARRQHLIVCTGVMAFRLEVDKHASLVRGVHFQSVGKDPKEAAYVQARREVIICSGAICTPQILLLSGIGPQQQLDTLQIPLKKDLPVGATLQDHISCAVMLNLPKSETLSLLESISGLWHFLLFIVLGKGLMGASSTPKTAYICTAALERETMLIKNSQELTDALRPSNVPDVEIMVQPVNSLERAVPGYSFLSFFTTLVQPKSSGSVELVNRDPLTNPRINHPMLSNPQDFINFRAGLRFAMKFADEFLESGYPHPASIAFAPGANAELLVAWEKDGPNVPPPAAGLTFRQGDGDGSLLKVQCLGENKTWKTVSDDEIDDYIRRVSMVSLHVSCTCPMSKDAKSGVVDQRLRVHGIKNLRIADASVFPKIPSGHTMAPTIMVAERCANFINDDLAKENATNIDSEQN